MSRKENHIVIIGGSFAGVKTAHRFLKSVQNKDVGHYKVTMISRDTHLYWNIAAPRAIVPGTIPDEKLFMEIAPGFSRYGSDKFEFVVGTATDIDIDKKQVKVDKSGKLTVVDYDYLIIGSGANTGEDSPFKSGGSTEVTKERLHSFQKRVQEAKSIIVAGAGPTGVETAGEIAYLYGNKKEVVLLSAGPVVLADCPEAVSKSAHSQLEALGVKVKLNARSGDAVTLPNGKKEVVLSGGERLTTDLLIPTFGMTPNSSFIPMSLLDHRGYVKVDHFFAVKGCKDVFAIGDVSDAEAPQLLFVDGQSAHMAKNLVQLVTAKPLIPYKVSTTIIGGVQIGNSGVGRYGNWKIPGFVIHALRKTLFIEQLPKTIENGA
ncbi:apoptosis-inducing factor 2 [Fusarium heterosporum]|uniref:Apoptosis-inducing factor 2 n=1 Tax=Fusarium heterosporum TaxID=42747 RepID=A0A8H5TCT9_FUSHE|nr:apoptosis-inducing factor 2 [Fusarium heterosporum]